MLFVLPSKSQAQLLLLCRYFRKRVVIMKHHPYRSPLRKYWSPKKGSPGWKLTFTSPQKATRSPTSSPTCKSIFQKVTQHARRSPQKETLSPNKFTNIQEILEELNSCHEERYKIKVTKTITGLKFVLIFFTRNIKIRKCPADETPCSPLKVVKSTMHKSVKKHKQMKKKRKTGVFYVPALIYSH